jgi:translation initiation factor 3 subunit D
LPNLNPGDCGTEITAGKLFAFDREWERVRMAKAKKLPQFKGLVPNEITTRDPIIQRLAQEEKAQIFATDLAAAALMTSSKAGYSWDLIIKKWGDIVFIDKRDEENMLDCQTVSETANVEY